MLEICIWDIHSSPEANSLYSRNGTHAHIPVFRSPAYPCNHPIHINASKQRQWSEDADELQ